MTQLTPGSPYPPGSHYDGAGVNFSLFSAHAQRVDLCLFNAAGEETCLPLPARSGNFWHGYLPNAQPGLHYGFRLHGPNNQEQGHRFNPATLLIDPYCRQLSSDTQEHLESSDNQPQPDSQNCTIAVPKSIVADDEPYDWQNDIAPRIPWSKTVIYEAHVRGLTRQHPDIPESIRGSYAALAHPAILDHLQKLGITALELLPIQSHLVEPRLQRLGLRNYWGYNVLAPFAITPDFWSKQPGSTPLSEFRDAVSALHRRGIEVILDVVFNHSAELVYQDVGLIAAQAGIDNRNYYWLDDQGNYLNWSGCGNTLRLTTPEVLQWVMDCLRYWVNQCHVDGFRFDLGTMLGRTPIFSADSPLLCAIRQDPILATCKLIAEPWDVTQDGYQLGKFPAPFAEWNDRFRDCMRRFWLQGNVSLGEFAQYFAASSQHFKHHGRHPSASINLITTHDGFTLRDLVCFNDKHNEPNGEQNQDGNDNNCSNNHGIEGLEASPEIQQQRQMSQRALLTTLLLSQGTPQLLGGDELGQSQNGNNNPYCQDNQTTWLDWSQADTSLSTFVSHLIELRKQIPALTQDQWWQEQENSSSVKWLNAQGQLMSVKEWQKLPPPVLQIQLSQSWLLIINPSAQTIDVTLPNGNWILKSSTLLPPPVTPSPSPVWHATAKSITVFSTGMEKTDASSPD